MSTNEQLDLLAARGGGEGTEARTTEELAAKLARCGDPRQTRSWYGRDIEYLRALGLERGDVPALLACARRWLEPATWADDADPTAWYVPIHAWRALAVLGAEETIDLLLEMLAPMEEQDTDWHLEEFPRAFARIGPSAFDAVAAYLADPDHLLFTRVCAARGLCRIAQAHPGERARAVDALSTLLRDYLTNGAELNAFLVNNLIDLEATESAELIERAFAARCVDEEVVGDWGSVRAELGVEGMGLVPDAQARRPPPMFLHTLDLEGRPRRFKSKATARRKKQRQARKRNRRR